MTSMRTCVAPLILLSSLGAQCRTPVTPTWIPPSPWTESGSPYCVQGDVTLAGITIGDNVEVWVAGNFGITITGHFHAQGTAGRPIRFRSQPGVSGGWKGIFLDNVSQTTQPVTFDHCVFTDGNQGVVHLTDSAPVFMDCSFQENQSGGSGGAVVLDVGTGNPRFERCHFSDNTAASHAGAILAATRNGSRLELQTCTFVRNRSNPTRATGNKVGGVLHLNGDAVLADCLLLANSSLSACNSRGCTATGRGGAIYLQAGSLEVVRCTLAQNLATAYDVYSGGVEHTWVYGGAIYVNGGALSVKNSVLAGNRASTSGTDKRAYGGAVYVLDGSAALTNVAIARNILSGSQRYGSGISIAAGTLTVRNSVLCANTGAAQLHAGSGASVTVEYSCVEGGYTGTGNNSFNPQFVGLGFTSGDLALSNSSPCIDAGDPDPAFDDAIPPGLGGPCNDQGAYGGPEAGGWIRPETFALKLHPDWVKSGSAVLFETAGAPVGLPAGLLITSVNGSPYFEIMNMFGTIDPGGRWFASLNLPTLPSGLEIGMSTVSVDPRFWPPQMIPMLTPEDIFVIR